MLKKLVVLALALAAVAFVAGYVLGRGSADPTWLEGEAHVSTEGRLASMEVEDWTYAVHASVPWYDRSGDFHPDGWPRCLRDDVTHVRFLAVSREIDTVGKPVLAVDCRDTH